MNDLKTTMKNCLREIKKEMRKMPGIIIRRNKRMIEKIDLLIKEQKSACK